MDQSSTAALALLAGAGFLWFKKNERKQAGLMALLALIMIANIAIWIVPTASGEAPVDWSLGRRYYEPAQTVRAC